MFSFVVMHSSNINKSMETMSSKRFGPLFKQCFLTAGVSINFATHGMVFGFTSVLLPQLRETTDISEASATWIASIVGISLIIGTLMVPNVMNKYGRKTANIISASLMTIGWLVITAAVSASSLLLARFLQGLSIGFLANMGNILIGECCSPQNRGPLLATIPLAILLGASLVHSLGTVISSFHTIALICACIAFSDLVIILLSTESPCFYAMNGRYDECRKAFRRLRDPIEDGELEKLIKINISIKSKPKKADTGILDKIKNNIDYFKTTFSKREVYKPVIILLHLYGLCQWSGGITFDSYTRDILYMVLGTDINYSVVIVSLDLQRLASTLIGIIAVKKMRRKLVLSVAVSVNIIAYFSIALYVYLKKNGCLRFDHPLVGIILLHIHLFTIVVGVFPLQNIIAGEILPVEHRAVCGMTGILFFSINETINMKSARYLFASIGLHGAYIIYGVLMVYFLIIALCLLPETKDRVLHDIEEEFRGKPLIIETKLIEKKQRKGKILKFGLN